MPVAAPCPTCQQLICSDIDDTALYSIESSLFPFVFNCPPGFDCSLATSFHMVCCGQSFSVDFPPGFSQDDKNAVIQNIVNQCAAILPTCGQGQPGCATPPCQTRALFYNQDATCSIKCPDGSTFTYTVVAGTFAALDQATADMLAQSYACEQVGLRRVCLGNFSACLCFNQAYTRTIPVSGGLPPFFFSIAGGALPPGLSLSISGVISGTTTAPGNYAFTVQCISSGGGSVLKAFGITVIQITSTQLPAFTIGVPYSYQLLATGGSGNYLWKIDVGTLPPGLVMDNTGLIHGTPT